MKTVFVEGRWRIALLDELLVMPLDVQRSLHEHLQEHRLGTENGVALIALTDGNLPQAVRAGQFRHDLAYRLLHRAARSTAARKAARHRALDAVDLQPHPAQLPRRTPRRAGRCEQPSFAR